MVSAFLYTYTVHTVNSTYWTVVPSFPFPTDVPWEINLLSYTADFFSVVDSIQNQAGEFTQKTKTGIGSGCLGAVVEFHLEIQSRILYPDLVKDPL
jgi:hypothetical protein